MYCQATTGKFVVRRCRNIQKHPCMRCGKFYCANHFDTETGRCLSCKNNKTMILDEQSNEKDSLWDEVDFYSDDSEFEYEVSNYATEEEFSNEDYDAFEDIRNFDQESDIDQAYDS